jgi:hypothetical protein
MSRDDYHERIREKKIELSFRYDIYEPNKNGMGEK